MTSTEQTRRPAPKKIQTAPLGQKIRWARQSAGLSHDKLVVALGRSNRGHLIKIEKGEHVPRRDLRDAIADVCDVPRELFALDDDEEEDHVSRLRRIRAELVLAGLDDLAADLLTLTKAFA